jgi:hypothetical protein
MDLRNIKVGFDAAKNFGKAQRLGMQYADDAFRAEVAANALGATSGASKAVDAAEFFNQRAQYMNDFVDAYAGQAPVYASKGQQLGRAIAGTTDVVGNVGGALLNNPMGQMALFSAPMVLPMLMADDGGQSQQLTPEQIQYMRQQQQMQQRGGYG